jgi:hypothetical protein
MHKKLLVFLKAALMLKEALCNSIACSILWLNHFRETFGIKV